MDAVVVIAKGECAVRKKTVPAVREGFILVKVRAIGLNPADIKSIDHEDPIATVLGFDYAGVVEVIGSNVTEFKPGDHVAGISHGSNKLDPDAGAFGEFIIARAALQMHIPNHISFEEAATLGVSTLTVGLGLYMTLGLPEPDLSEISTHINARGGNILIHGGSTATGMYGIQYAKASGQQVIATSSPHNFDLLKSLGASAVFDYHSDSCANDIRAITNGELYRAWDCSGTGVELCAKVLKPSNKSIYCTIVPGSASALHNLNPDVDGPAEIMGFDAMGEPYIFLGHVRQQNQEQFEYTSSFFKLAEKLLRAKTIRPIRSTVNWMGSGLHGAIKGLKRLDQGRVSGEKLVYTLD